MKAQVMKCLSQKGRCHTSEIAAELKTTDYQARYYLMRLEREGKVKRSPLRRGAKTQWEITEPCGGQAI